MHTSKQEQYETNGLVVSQSILNSAEIEKLRAILLARFSDEWIEQDCGKHIANAAANCPELSWLYSHPAIIAAVKSVLGNKELIFTGNSDLHLNKLGGWHKDLCGQYERYVDQNSIINEDFNICKIGIYLQDEHDNKNGFMVEPGSHLYENLQHTNAIRIETNTGDVSLFDPRITHAAMQPDIIEKIIWRLFRSKNNKFGRILKEAYWTLKKKPQRLSIFFTYGTKNRITQEFCQNNTSIEKNVAAANNAEYKPLPNGLVKELKSSGVGTY